MNRNAKPPKPWKKGQSGNPKGRPPKNDSWKNIFLEMLQIEDITLPDGTKISRKKAIAHRAVQEALKGKIEAMNFIGKYTESAEPTRVNHIDADGNPIEGAVFVMQKETLSSWQKRLNKETTSGRLSQGKQRRSLVPHLKCSSAEPKAEGKATSSSETKGCWLESVFWYT